MSRSGAPLPVPSSGGQGPTVGPFMIYPVRAQAGIHRKAATLGDYLDAIYRRKWWVLALVASAVSATWWVSSSLPPLYESTATLDVERLTTSGVVGPESVVQVAPDMDQFMATHVSMLHSDAVLRPVALSFNLSEDEGSRSPGKDFRKRPVRLRSLKIARPPNTYLIQIGYRHRDPEMAASVANAIARTYIAHLRSLREGAWTTLAGSSARQIGELHERMERSSQALLDYQRTIGMVDPDDKTNVWTTRLVQLNTDYARAQADRAAKQASFDTLQTGAPEAAEASMHGELLKRLIEKKGEAAQKFSDVKTLFAENHPEYKRANAQVREVDEQLKAQYRKAVQRSESELREARLRESNLKAAYEQSKLEADTVASHAVQYRMLRQRADSDRILYDELSRKVGEAGINSGLRGSPVKLADSARADWKPASPNVPLNSAVALLASLVLGCAGAVLLESRRARIRNAEDLKAAAGAHVVSVLPSVRAWRGRRGLAMFSERAQSPKRGDAEMPRFREEVRMLRNGLSQPAGQRQTQAIAVVSPGEGEGRSRIAMELAAAYAAIGRRTLLIDANLRRPVLHTMFFSTGPRVGLSTALSGETTWREAVMQAVESNAPDLLPSGSPAPRSCDLLHQRLFGLLDEAVGEYDAVVVDSPPFLAYSETLDIARAVDAVVAVARAGATHPHDFERMLQYLQRMDARVAGIVLNDA